MTRQEFIHNITTWPELLSFCYDYDCDVCADIVSHENLGEQIAEDFDNYGYDYPWTDIRRWLNDIDDSADYYYRSGSFEYESVDDDFEEYKDEVLSWGDDTYIFDDEDEDEDEGSFVDSDVFNDDISDNDCSVEEFLGLCSPTIKS